MTLSLYGCAYNTLKVAEIDWFTDWLSSAMEAFRIERVLSLLVL